MDTGAHVILRYGVTVYKVSFVLAADLGVGFRCWERITGVSFRTSAVENLRGSRGNGNMRLRYFALAASVAGFIFAVPATANPGSSGAGLSNRSPLWNRNLRQLHIAGVGGAMASDTVDAVNRCTVLTSLSHTLDHT